MSCSYDCQAESEYLEDKLKLELGTNISGLFAGSQAAFDCRSPTLTSTLIAGVKKRQRRRRRRCRHRRHRRLRGRCRKVENVLNQKVSFINQACQLALSLSHSLSPHSCNLDTYLNILLSIPFLLLLSAQICNPPLKKLS